MQYEKKIKQDAAVFLGLLGVADIDSALLGFCVRGVVEHILNATNQRELPKGLHMAAVYRTAGEYLRLKKVAGVLSEAGMEAAVSAAMAISEIRESEVTVKFHVDQTLEQKFTALVEALAIAGKDDFTRWRRLVW